MTRLAHIAVPLLAALPLAMLTLWAYLPAQPHVYLNAGQLLTETYTGPARELSRGAFGLRLALLVLVSGGLALLLARGALSWGARVLAGVSASLVLILPAWVPWLLSATPGVEQLVLLLLTCVSMVVLQFAVRRLPATAWPVAALCLLIGVSLSVRSAAQVTLFSNPPLRVLHDIGRQPQSARANLAMAYHLLSLGGEKDALAYFGIAGRLLLDELGPDSDPRLLEAARELVNLQERSLRDQLPDPLTEPEAPQQ